MTETPPEGELEPLPSFWREARRPRWIAMLLVSLLVAAGFAWLGQWQLGRAVENAVVVERDTETVVPLAQLISPGEDLTTDAADRMTEADGSYTLGDFLVVADRAQGDDIGYWVVGRFVLSDTGATLAVALGWTSSEDEAQTVANDLDDDVEVSQTTTVTGRLTAPEAVDVDQSWTGPSIDRMSLAWLANAWTTFSPPVIEAYLVSHDTPPDGLEAISSPTPVPQAELNWLNLFYALEWAFFAGFAVFLWWRLVADAVRRDREERGLLPVDDEDSDID